MREASETGRAYLCAGANGLTDGKPAPGPYPSVRAPQPQKAPGDVIGDNLSFCEYGSKKAIFSASKKEPARARAPHDAGRRVLPTARVIALTATCLTPLDSLDMLNRA